MSNDRILLSALLDAYRWEHPENGTPMSKQKLAKNLGVSRQALSAWVNGNSQPSYDNVLKIASLLNVSLDVLAGR